ncbi:MAG: hypothetical protein IPL78_03145 [Chloroflexi bacterium]|nr:hypothetical protein [Chloroflexota bacterium]
MRFFLHPYSTRIKQWAGLCLGLMLFGWFAAAAAQPPTWDEPLNLSQSGTAAFPQLFQDNEGQLHILWQDTLQRQFLYVTNRGLNWSEPTVITAPFTAALSQSTAADPLPPIVPTFLTDDAGTVHTFWRNSLNELRYSRVAVADLADAEQWSPAVTLASNVPSFAVTDSPNGQLAVLFVIAGDDPEIVAGVYFQGSDDGVKHGGRGRAFTPHPIFPYLGQRNVI